MTTPDATQPPWDPGMQNERTRLARQRTTLAGLTCSLLVARLIAPASLVLAVAVGLAAVLSSATLAWFSTKRYVDNHLALHRHRLLAGARSHLVVTGLVVVTAVAATAYVAGS